MAQQGVGRAGSGMRVSGEGSSRRPVGRAALDPLKRRWLTILLYKVVEEGAVLEMPIGSAPQDLGQREKKRADVSRDLSGPILP